MNATTETPLSPIEPGTYIDDPTDFEYKGRRFRVTLVFDDDAGPPQEVCDGHGVIVEENNTWTRYIDARPNDMEAAADAHGAGEIDDEELAAASLLRELTNGRKNYDTLWYDVLRTLQLAEKDGWGTDAAWMAAHPDATPAEIRMAAVERDFEYLSGWYNDDWCYVGVVVTLLAPEEDGDDEEVDTTSCWCFESTDTEGQNEYVRDAVEELIRSNP